MKLENVGKLFDEVIRVVKEWIITIFSVNKRLMIK